MELAATWLSVIGASPAGAYSYAFIGGIVPALLWLLFFLREDRLHPEPRKLLIFTFIAGMSCVIFVLPVQRFAYGFLTGGSLLLAWAFIEELFKYWAAYLVVLWQSAVDEPMDPVIYMITAALGFAALENALFMSGPLLSGNPTEALITGNLRFIGAALLHVVASASIGMALALSFYRKSKYKRLYFLTGFILSVLLHTIFNFFIMESNGGEVLIVFSFVWIGVILLLLLFERIKLIKKPLPTSIFK